MDKLNKNKQEDTTQAIVNLVGANIMTNIFLLHRQEKKGSHQSDDANPFEEVGEWEQVTPQTIQKSRWNLDLWDYVSLSFLLRRLTQKVKKIMPDEE